MKVRKGFTLIELLVVIAIIGILSTLAVIALNTARQKSRDAKRVSDIKQVQTALELYFADSGNKYPIQAVAIDLGEGNYVTLGSTNGFGVAPCAGTCYMGQVPADPQTSTTHYIYQTDAAGTTYTLLVTLEGTTGSLASGNPHCITDWDSIIS